MKGKEPDASAPTAFILHSMCFGISLGQGAGEGKGGGRGVGGAETAESA